MNEPSGCCNCKVSPTTVQLVEAMLARDRKLAAAAKPLKARTDAAPAPAPQPGPARQEREDLAAKTLLVLQRLEELTREVQQLSLQLRLQAQKAGS